MPCRCDHTRGQSCGWCDGTYADDPRIQRYEDAALWADPSAIDRAADADERHFYGD